MKNYLSYIIAFLSVALAGGLGWFVLKRRTALPFTPQLPPDTSLHYGDALQSVTQSRLGKTAIAPAIAGTWKDHYITPGQHVLLDGFITTPTLSQADAQALFHQIDAAWQAKDAAWTQALEDKVALLHEDLVLGGWDYNRPNRMLHQLQNPIPALSGEFVVKSVFKNPGSGNIKYVTLENAPDFVSGKGSIRLAQAAGFSNTYPILY